MSECKHLLEPDTCSLCNGRSPRQVSQQPENIVKARFAGRCGFCDGRIHEDASLGLIDGQWIHLTHFQDI